MKKLIHIFVLSCKRATALIEKQSFNELSVIEKWQLKWHLKLCDFCERYKKQTTSLNKILHRLSQENEIDKQENIKELKEKILHEIESHKN